MKKHLGLILSFSLLLTGCKNTEEKHFPELLGLQWYEEIDNAKLDMHKFTLKEESEEIGLAGDLQTLLEYSDVTLYEQPCDVILCFTSLGLIGINYHDPNGQYEDWLNRIATLYGNPTEKDDFYAAWDNAPLGTKTTIYIFSMENEVQISFFTDQSGSETVSLS